MYIWFVPMIVGAAFMVIGGAVALYMVLESGKFRLRRRRRSASMAQRRQPVSPAFVSGALAVRH